MKNYDLSQYMLREDNLILFPLTYEEIMILIDGKDKFQEYIRLPYFAKDQNKEELLSIASGVDMNDDYWFLKTQWVAVDVKERAIIARLNLKQEDIFNKIIYQINDEKCLSVKRDDVVNLFYKFLNVNNYVNIISFDVDGRKNEN